MDFSGNFEVLDAAFVFVPMISLVAFSVKGVSGMGTGMIVVPLASLVIEPKSAVILASLVGIFGGFSMLRVDRVWLAPRYWIPIAVTMVLGSIAGALTLEVIPIALFSAFLSLVFLFWGIWFVLRASASSPGESPSPISARLKDLIVGSLAGFLGGFVGINAPPLILYFSRHLNKRLLRRLLVLISLPAVLAQTFTFASLGLLNTKLLSLGVLMIPGLVVGIYLGNRMFSRLSEAWFRRILGAILVVSSAKLLLGVSM